MTAKMATRPCANCGNARAFVSGAWLRAKRERAGLSLREVARRLGYSAAYVCDLELGRRDVTTERAERFLAALEA